MRAKLNTAGTSVSMLRLDEAKVTLPELAVVRDCSEGQRTMPDCFFIDFTEVCNCI